MTTIIRPEAFAARRDLCIRAGLRTMTYDQARADSAARAGRPDFARTVVHECGHAGAFLDASCSFLDIVVRADGTGGALSAGARPSGPIPPERERSMVAAVAAALGGVCAEMALLGSVSSWQTLTDMTHVWERADGDQHLVRQEAQRLLRLFEDHRGAIRHMAHELRRAGRLLRTDCVRFCRDAGWLVDVEPKVLPTRIILSAKTKADADAEAEEIDADATADAAARNAELVAEIHANPAKQRKDWSVFLRKFDPRISDEKIASSWQRLADEIGLEVSP
jgi:hypothetical protein